MDKTKEIENELCRNYFKLNFILNNNIQIQ